MKLVRDCFLACGASKLQLPCVIQGTPLKTADEWPWSCINWLLDVIAPNKEMTTSVIANFKQVVKDGDLRLHPIVTKLVDAETLEKMGAKQQGASSKGDER